MGFLLGFMIYSLSLKAQIVSDTVNNKAGDLGNVIGFRIDSISNLTLTGNINGTDISILRSMKRLTMLDMSNASIVSGGHFSINSSTFYVTDNTIPEDMFYEIGTLKTVLLPKNITSIGYGAFCRCYNLSSISIPEGVTNLGENAFLGCGSLTTINIPSSITSYSANAFPETRISEFTISLNDTIHSTLEGVLFNKNKTKLLLYPYAKISEYSVPVSVNTIGNGAFARCRNLSKINFPNSIKAIEDYAFSNCTGLTSISIPSSVTEIRDNVFDGCTALSIVILPNTIKTIGKYSFANCNKIFPLIIPNNVKSIGEGAFSFCTRAISLNIPDSVNFIGDYAFGSCTSLTSVTLPENLNQLGKGAFSSCTSLESIIIPDNIELIGENTFSSCLSLTTCEVPKRLKSIGSGAFNSCSKLTSFNMPDSVTTIGAYAFYGTGITSITIPKYVNSIGDYAFSCYYLNEIYCLSETPPSITRKTFSNVDNTICKLYVPGVSFSLYSFSLGWNLFSNKIAPIHQADARKVNVFLNKETIVVQGLDFGELISIYSISGALIYRKIATDDIVKVNVHANQLYVVKTARKTFILVI